MPATAIEASAASEPSAIEPSCRRSLFVLPLRQKAVPQAAEYMRRNGLPISRIRSGTAPKSLTGKGNRAAAWNLRLKANGTYRPNCLWPSEPSIFRQSISSGC